jgi:hypothetical protein
MWLVETLIELDALAPILEDSFTPIEVASDLDSLKLTCDEAETEEIAAAASCAEATVAARIASA